MSIDEQIRQWLGSAIGTIERSPLRLSIEDGAGLPSCVQYHEVLESALVAGRTVLGNLDRQLKVVVMGEVKSGKSTLVNALAGRVVSPTDFLEATGVIIEVSCGEDATGAITHEDGETTAGSIESILSTLVERRSDSKFLSSCAVVEIVCPSQLLTGMSLVDTPGLLTITEAHHARTESYVDNADLVLWVLNANYIGQEDVVRSIESVASKGKPVVLVVNKVDQVRGDADRLMEYAEQMYSPYCRAIVPLSASRAFDAAVIGDETGMRQSGFTDLVQFLSGRIMADTGDVKTESAVESVKAILATDAKLHEDFADEIERVQEVQKSANAQIDAACMYIEDSIRQTLWDEVMYVLLEREAREWVSVGRSLDSHDVPGYLEAQMAQDKIMDAVRRWLPQAETRVKAQYEQTWAEKSEKIGSEFTSATALIRKESTAAVAWGIARLSEAGFDLGYPAADESRKPFDFDIHTVDWVFTAGIGLVSLLTGAPLLGALFISWAFLFFNKMYDHLSGPRETQHMAPSLEPVIQPALDRIRRDVWKSVEGHVMSSVREENARRRAELVSTAERSAFNGWNGADAGAMARNARDYAASARKVVDEAPTVRAAGLMFETPRA